LPTDHRLPAVLTSFARRADQSRRQSCPEPVLSRPARIDPFQTVGFAQLCEKADVRPAYGGRSALPEFDDLRSLIVDRRSRRVLLYRSDAVLHRAVDGVALAGTMTWWLAAMGPGAFEATQLAQRVPANSRPLATP